MLIYRFPGKEIVKKKGSFQYFDDLPESGFIVSDFKGDNRFLFVEKDQENKLYFKTDTFFVINREEYLRKGNLLISALKGIGISKTVYSRIMEVAFDENKSIDLFHELEKSYPMAFVYLFSDERLGTWVGASPEILLRKINSNGFTISLAGTKRSDDQSIWHKKDKLEQAYVSDYISNELHELQVTNIEQSAIYEFQAGPVKHLRTDFSFTIRNDKIDSFLKNIHPTPAVSGLPQTLALELIDQIETHNRDLYAGYLGEIENQNSSIFVNLRCCQITKGKIFLYVGGGYTIDSDPEKEWIETENKSKTIIDLIQKV